MPDHPVPLSLSPFDGLPPSSPEEGGRAQVLYVDDEPENLEVFSAQFGETYDVLTASSGPAALEVLSSLSVDVMLTDQRMPGMEGNRLIEETSRLYPLVVPVVITAYGDTELILGAIRAGRIHDYVLKPWKPARLAETLRSAVEESRRRRRLEEAFRDRQALREEVRSHYDPSALVGADAGLRAVMERVRHAAASRSTVLITGETGTGKEMIARAVHALSPRADRALVKIDCAALAPTLAENELFGHTAGAFTGAQRLHAGRFEQADGGTVFLDEIGELPLALQPRLLRVLQDRVVDRLGGSGPVRVDVRIIAATSRQLPDEVARGAFRQDLYYRLAVVPIELPPLRGRLDDLPALVRHFLRKHAGHRAGEWRFGPGLLERLRGYDWPGNVRELENLVERAVVLGAGPELRPSDLGLPPVRGLVEPLDGQPIDGETARIREALEQAGGNVTQAARLLGVPRSTLLNRLRRLGVR